MKEKETINIDNSNEFNGVSTARIYTGYLERNGLVFRVLVKEERNIYDAEVKAARLLRNHLPIVETFVYKDRDTAIYPLIGNARTLHDVLTDPATDAAVSNDLFNSFLLMHLNMWKDTLSTPYFHHTGYPKKLKETRQAVLDRAIGMTPLSDRANLPMQIYLNRQINGGETNHEVYDVPSVETSLDWMEKQIRESLKLGVCLTHGDENMGNCLVRNPDVIGINYSSPLVMIDLNGAGYRSPFESITKIRTWLRVSQVEHQSFRFGTDLTQSTSELMVNYSLDQRYLDLESGVIDFMKQNLRFLDDISEADTTAFLNAYQMMYLLREAAFYTDRRQRPEIVPYLVASAFSLAGNKIS